ncbi:MAG: efflux RND transporter permease subunit, partial [Myxococcota bacterium]|nr:efflux RND transporter permease subunit [Myxococcota bacterium]
MKWIPRFSVQRPVSTIMLFIATVVLGMISWTRIPLELLPDTFESGQLWLVVPYGDSQPKETEEKITLPVEDALSDLAGIKMIRSTSSYGRASFSLGFHRSTNMDSAYNGVVDRMERLLPDLPEEGQEYYVYKWNMSDAPIMWAGVGLEGTAEEKYDLLYNVVQKKLERVSGVGGVNAWGSDPKSIFVDFRRDALMEHRVGSWEILQQLREENFQLPSGKLVENGTIRYVRSF